MEVVCLCRQPENKRHAFLYTFSLYKPVKSDVKVCSAEDIGGARSDSAQRGKDTCQELILWYDHGAQQDLISHQTTEMDPSKRKSSTIKFYFK